MSNTKRPRSHTVVPSPISQIINVVPDSQDTVDDEQQKRRKTSGLSLEDIEAAQALEGLRAGTPSFSRELDKHLLKSDTRVDYVRAPSYRSHHVSDADIDAALRSTPSSSSCQEHREVEPLLSLVTSHHPLLSTAINGSLNAYTSSKSYSPRFRYGAELVERHIGSPMASTVATASRLTGADSAARWLYRRSESRTKEKGSERTRISERNNFEQRDVERGPDHALFPKPLVHEDVDMYTGDTFLSEPLPRYDAEERSPKYVRQEPSAQPRQNTQPSDHQTWTQTLITTTSGLGVAMKPESLRRLKYCLKWLRWANNQLHSMTIALQDLINECRKSQHGASEIPTKDEDGDLQSMAEPTDQDTITSRMRYLKSRIQRTLKQTIEIVSTYAGGALPTNAQNLVRSQLFSFPARVFFASPRIEARSAQTPLGLASPKHIASQGVSATGSTAQTIMTQGSSPDLEQNSYEAEVKSALRVMILAHQGLDILSQVSGVIDGTIDQADKWLDRMGRGETKDDKQQGGTRSKQKAQWQQQHVNGQVNGHMNGHVKQEDHDGEELVKPDDLKQEDLDEKEYAVTDDEVTTVKDEKRDREVKLPDGEVSVLHAARRNTQ